MVAKPLPPDDSEWTARDRVVVVLIAVALLGVGLLMTVGGVAVKVTAADKAERLHERRGDDSDARGFQGSE
jgi:hypothetical protein